MDVDTFMMTHPRPHEASLHGKNSKIGAKEVKNLNLKNYGP